MTKIIQFPKESYERTKIFESPSVAGTSTETGGLTTFFAGEEAYTDYPIAPANHAEINDLVAVYERDPEKRSAIEEARARLARTVHAGSPTTVRTMRLRRGWSQVRFAKLLGTSQSHVARIERGHENLTLQTCRKLCSVLGIDMNTLDQALIEQEALNAERT